MFSVCLPLANDVAAISYSSATTYAGSSVLAPADSPTTGVTFDTISTLTYPTASLNNTLSARPVSLNVIMSPTASNFTSQGVLVAVPRRDSGTSRGATVSVLNADSRAHKHRLNANRPMHFSYVPTYQGDGLPYSQGSSGYWSSNTNVQFGVMVSGAASGQTFDVQVHYTVEYAGSAVNSIARPKPSLSAGVGQVLLSAFDNANNEAAAASRAGYYPTPEFKYEAARRHHNHHNHTNPIALGLHEAMSTALLTAGSSAGMFTGQAVGGMLARRMAPAIGGGLMGNPALLMDAMAMGGA